MAWRNNEKHIWARRLMNVLAALFSWKAYKLSYCGFFGFRLRPATFSNPKVFRDLMRKAVYFNIVFTYMGVIILNVYGMIDLNWGRQMYIMMIENTFIAALMIVIGLWEAKKCDTTYLADPKPK